MSITFFSDLVKNRIKNVNLGQIPYLCRLNVSTSQPLVDKRIIMLRYLKQNIKKMRDSSSKRPCHFNSFLVARGALHITRACVVLDSVGAVSLAENSTEVFKRHLKLRWWCTCGSSTGKCCCLFMD
jgi:predicted metal-dependent peptidase